MGSKIAAFLREAVRSAVLLALIGGVIYAALFIDFTGGGSLWSVMPHLREGGRETEAARATRVVTVAPADGVKVHEDKILAVFDDPHQGKNVTAEYAAPEGSPIAPPTLLHVPPAAKTPAGKMNAKVDLRSYAREGDASARGAR